MLAYHPVQLADNKSTKRTAARGLSYKASFNALKVRSCIHQFLTSPDAYIVLMDPATRAVHDYTIANSAAQATGSADTTAQQDDSSSKNMTTDKARFNGPGLLSPAPQMNWGGSALGLKGMETGVAFDNSQMDVPPTPVTPVTPLELKWGRAELPSRGGGGR